MDVDRSVGEFGIAERTRIAIARALPDNDDPALIVLDEPTAALPARDVEALFDTIRGLTAAGNSVILVSHHLDEILGVSDSITVLRDGVKVACVPTSEVDHDQLTRLIIGASLVKNVDRPRVTATDNPANVQISGLEGTALLDFSAELRHGEIVGVAGLTGSGREAVAGLTIGREQIERESCRERVGQ